MVATAAEDTTSEKSLFLVPAVATSLGEDLSLFPFPLDCGVFDTPPS